jgi:hypothetical protein
MCFRCVISTNEARLVLSCRVLRLAKCKATIPPHTLYCTNFFDGVLESSGKLLAVETSGDQRSLLRLPWPIVWNVVLLNFLRNVVRCGHIRPPITVRRARSILGDERNCIGAHYFHTKSRQRQIAGTRRSVNQKTLSVNSCGSSPQYSRENPILGAMTT